MWDRPCEEKALINMVDRTAYIHKQVFNVGEEAKRRGMDAKEMAAAVDAGLRLNGWFVTGRVDASLFSDSFFFSDPQVRVGVNRMLQFRVAILQYPTQCSPWMRRLLAYSCFELH